MEQAFRTDKPAASRFSAAWLIAFGIGGAVVGWLGAGGAAVGAAGTGTVAYAAATEFDVAHSDDLVALTCDGGTDDVLLVIDQRSEQMMVYYPRTQTELQFVQKYALRDLFTSARLQYGGRPSSPAPEGSPSPR